MHPADTAVTPRLLREWPLPEAEDGSDKHARGTVVVVGGAVSTPGALLLAGLGALRAGAGRLQVLTVKATAVALAVALPEAGVVGLPAGAGGSLAPGAADAVLARCEGADAVVLGPGLMDKAAAGELLGRPAGTDRHLGPARRTGAHRAGRSARAAGRLPVRPVAERGRAVRAARR